MEEMWLARDKDATLWCFIKEPKKGGAEWLAGAGTRLGMLPFSAFPEVQWSDEEPTKVKLVIDK